MSQSEQQIREKVAERFKQTANQVTRMVESSPLTILTGPFRSGKSEIILPLIARQLEGKDFQTIIRDARHTEYRRPSYRMGMVNKLPQTERGVLIIDEAAVISELGSGKDIQAILGSAHDLNYKVLSVVPYHAGDMRVRNTETRLWQEAERSLSGSNSPAYHMDPVRIDRQLFRDLIEAKIAKRGRPVPIDHIDYLVQRVPTCLGTVDQLEFILAEASFNPDIRVLALNTLSYIDIWKGMLTNKEAEALRKLLLQTATPGYK